MAHRKRTLGIALGLIAAVCYGFIPLLTIPIQSDIGHRPLSPSTILLYRFGMATIVVGIIMLVRRISFHITYPEFIRLTFFALLSDGAALFLIAGYPYMSSGVATTIHFMYPIITMMMMMTFFHEPRRPSTLIAVAMAVAGVGILSWDSGGTVQWIGIVLELISALCFSLYLIRVNHSSHAQRMDTTKLTFYVLALGTLIFTAIVVYQEAVVNLSSTYALLPAPGDWLNLALLSIACTVVTNISLIYSTKLVGPTVASVLGALEPVTAILVGLAFLGEHLTCATLMGIAIILPAVIIIVLQHRKED